MVGELPFCSPDSTARMDGLRDSVYRLKVRIIVMFFLYRMFFVRYWTHANHNEISDSLNHYVLSDALHT